jgi:hypothetical protein
MSSLIDRWLDITENTGFTILCVIVLTPIVSYVGLLAGSLILPILQTLVIVFFFIPYVASRRLWTAAGLVLLWSLLASIIVAGYYYTTGCNTLMIDKVIHGEKYIKEMLPWVLTGKGAEGDPSIFLIPKVEELTIFTLISLVTAGIGGLFMGSILLNYMNTYYGVLVWLSKGSPVAILMGWPVYAIIRVIGYTFLGTILAYTVIEWVRMRNLRINTTRDYKLMLLLALILIALDFILKSTIANIVYQPVLNNTLDPGRLAACRARLGI